jgi:hypothetical protein
MKRATQQTTQTEIKGLSHDTTRNLNGIKMDCRAMKRATQRDLN